MTAPLLGEQNRWRGAYRRSCASVERVVLASVSAPAARKRPPEVSWPRAHGVLSAFGGAFLVAVAGVLLWATLSSDAPPAWAWLVGLGLLPGLVLGYMGLAHTLNSTRVDIAAGRLQVEYGPVPWKRGLSAELSTVHKFGTYERRFTGVEVGPHVEFGVMLWFRNGTSVRLAPTFESQTSANAWLGKLEAALAAARDAAE